MTSHLNIYQKILTSDGICINQLLCFLSIAVVPVALECASPTSLSSLQHPVFSL